MSTKTYIAFARKGIVLDAKKDELENKFFHKKASLETLTKEHNQRKYESARNVCEKCFTLKSVKTQECNCF